MLGMYNQKPKDPSYSLVINAGVHEVWRVWTEKELLSKWWAPPESSPCIINVNLTHGGAFIYEFINNGRQYHEELIYVQLIKDRRIVMTNALNKDLRPTTQSYMTIVIEILARGNTTQFTSKILFRDIRVLRWFSKTHWYQGWINNLQYMAQLAESISPPLGAQPAPIPPVQP